MASKTRAGFVFFESSEVRSSFSDTETRSILLLWKITCLSAKIIYLSIYIKIYRATFHTECVKSSTSPSGSLFFISIKHDEDSSRPREHRHLSKSPIKRRVKAISMLEVSFTPEVVTPAARQSYVGPVRREISRLRTVRRRDISSSPKYQS